MIELDQRGIEQDSNEYKDLSKLLVNRKFKKSSVSTLLWL